MITDNLLFNYIFFSRYILRPLLDQNAFSYSQGRKNAAGILSVLKTQEDREEFYSNNSSMKRMKRKSNDLHGEFMEAKHQKIIQNLVTIQVFENGYFHFESDLSKSSTLGTLITSCAEHIGVPPSWIGLLYNDRKIDDNDTPELLAMKQFNKIELQKFGWIPIKISDHILSLIESLLST